MEGPLPSTFATFFRLAVGQPGFFFDCFKEAPLTSLPPLRSGIFSRFSTIQRFLDVYLTPNTIYNFFDINIELFASEIVMLRVTSIDVSF